MDTNNEVAEKERQAKAQEIEVTKARIRVAQEISANAKREQEALEGYYLLLDRCIPYLWQNDIKDDAELQRFKADIEEIIADELNHAAKLQKWAEKFGGVKENRT